MNPRDLPATLWALGDAGVELAIHPTDHDRVRHRPATMPPDLLAALRTHKGAILALLRDGYTPDNPEAEYVQNERLGIANDLGMATHPGSPAWLIAVGEATGAGEKA